MSKTIDVSLRFNAETGSVKKQLNDLKSTLYDIGNIKVDIKGGNIDEAVQSARKLFDALQDATDIDTGKLDFSKLDKSLKGANTSIQETSRHLLNLGPQGTQAFGQLAGAIANSETRIHKMNGTLEKFMNTMVSNVMWSASNMVLDGVKEGVQDAIKHIEKLDRSLNDIRIVTGKSNEQMQAFAKQANEAARALKATTTEYTDASLIYFQQGLSGDDVTERTDATIKMAKVTGDSVTEVSNQLTAIWNNFDNGTKSLEYYADVITALGASTASSTDEIATGLEKFSAVADTVGLSYEYATAALATVTSETRQSAEVVGTAFKTLFSRIQDLELGKTLDDGTTMGTYSKALDKVGISIKDQNGELKTMDKILDEMGEKWQYLNKDQQVALAQAVGGVRQYGQLISLMDNWDKMQQNVGVAKNSTGTLNEQFDIAKDSIESLDKELENVKEKLYQQIFNADMIKDFKKVLIDIVETINRIIDSAGGLKGLLSFAGMFALKALLPKLSGGVKKLTESFKDMSGYTDGKKLQVLSDMEVQLTGKNSTEVKDSWEIHRKKKTEDKNTSKEGTLYSTNGSTANEEKEAKPISEPAFDTTITDKNSLIQASNEMQGQIVAKQKERLIMSDLLTERQKQELSAQIDSLQAQKEAVDLAAQEKIAAEEKLTLLQKQAIKEEEMIKRKLAARQEELQGRGEDITLEQQEDDANLEAIEADDTKTDKQKEAARKAHAARKAKRGNELKRISEEMTDIDSKIGTKEQREKAEVEGKKVQVDFSGAAMERQKGIVEQGDKPAAVAAGMIASDLAQSGLGTESGVPAANVETAIKLGELQKQYITDSQTANGLAQELEVYQNQIAAAGAKSAGEITKGNKEQEKLKNVSGQVAKTLKQYEKTIDKSTDEGKALLKVLEKIDKEGDEFNLGDLSADELDAVKKGMKQVGKNTKDAADQAEGWKDAIGKDAGDILNGEAAGIQGVGDAAGEVQTKIEELNEKKQIFDENVKEPSYGPDPMGSLTQGAQDVIGGLTSLQMSYTTFHSGMMTIMDEEASGFEKIMGAVGMASSAMTLYNGVMQVGQGIMNLVNGAKALFAVLTGKETAAQVTGLPAILANTGAKIANAIATVLCVEASKGLAGVVTGVLAVGMIVGAAAIGVATMNSIQNAKALEEDTKKAEENAAASEKDAASAKELAAAKKEEYENVKKLTNEYEELYNKYKAGAATKEDLIEKAKRLAIELGDETLLIMAQRGEYEKLIATMKELEGEKRAESVDAAQKNVTAANTNFKNQLVKEMNAHKNDDGDVKTGELDTGMEFGTLLLHDDQFYVNIGPGEHDADAIYWKKIGKGNSKFNWKAVEDGDRGYGYVYEGEDPVNDWLKLEADFENWFYENNKAGGVTEGLNIGESETYNKTVAMRNGAVGSAFSESESAKTEERDLITSNYVDNAASGMSYGEYVKWAQETEEKLIAQGIDPEEFSKQMMSGEYASSEAIRKYIENKNPSKAAQDFLMSSYFLTMANKYGAQAALDMAEDAGIFSGVFDNTEVPMNAMRTAMKAFEGNAKTSSFIEWQEKSDKAISTLRDTGAADFDAKKFFDENEWLYKGENALFDQNEISEYYGMTPENLADEIASRQSSQLYSGGFSPNVAAGNNVMPGVTAAAGGRSNGGIHSTGPTMVFAPVKAVSAKEMFGQKEETEEANQETELAAYNWLLSQNDVLTDEKKAAMTRSVDKNDSFKLGNTATWVSTYGMNDIEITTLKNSEGKGTSTLVNAYNTWNKSSNSPYTSIAEFARAVSDSISEETLTNLGIDSAAVKSQATYFLSELDKTAEAKGFTNGYTGVEDAESLFLGEETSATSAFDTQSQENAIKQSEENWDNYLNYLRDKEKAEAVSYEISEDYITEYAAALREANSETEMSVETSQDLARQMLITARAFDSFSNNWKTYGETVKQAAKDTDVWDTEMGFNAQKALAKDLGSLSGMDQSFFTKEVLTDLTNKGILDLLEQGEGIEELRGYVLKQIYSDENGEEIIEGFHEMIDQATQELNDLEIGASIDSSTFMQNLLEMMMASGASVEQMQAALDTLGFKGEISYLDLQGNETITETGEVYDNDGKLVGKTTATFSGGATGRIPIMVPKEGGGWTFGSDIVFDGGSKTVNKPSGGGGGSKKKKVEDETERYHEINEKIDDLSAAYDRLSDAKDRAFGKSKLDLMDQELAKKKELIEAQKEYIKEIEENLENDMAYAKGVGVEIDLETGRVINYDEIIAKWVEDYNAGKMSDEEFDDAKKFLEQYEETLNLYEEEIQNLFDQQNEYLTAQLDNISVEIEMDVRVLDSDLNLIEYHFEHLEDTIHDSVKAITLLTDKTNNLMMKSLSYQEGIKDVLSIVDAEGNRIFNDAEVQALLAGDMSVLNGKNLTTEQLDALEEYSQNLLDLNNELIGIYDTIGEKFSTAFSSVNEDLNEQIATMQHLGQVAQGYKDIVDLVGKDNFGISRKVLQDLNSAALNTSVKALESQKEVVEFNRNAVAETQALLDDAIARGDDLLADTLREQIKIMNQTLQESESTLMSSWNEALTQAQEMFAAAAQEALDTFEETMAGMANSFDDLQSHYDQYSDITKRYLEDYQEIYELSKLNREVEKQISNLDSVKAKEKLRDIQEEINKLQASGVKMSQYELDELRARYDLRVAEIALEEAQNAKNQVRMQRDSEGNWAYVYTTNQSQLDQAQQTYEDKLYAYQKVTQEYLTNIESQLISVPKEFADAVAQINEDLTLTEEERKEKLDNITKYYTEKYNYLLEELNKALEDSAELYDSDWKEYSKNTNYKISLEEDWRDTFEETFYAQEMGYKNIKQAQEEFKKATEKFLEELERYYRTWQGNLELIMQSAGSSIDGFADDVANTTERIYDETDQARQSFISLAETADEMFFGLADVTRQYSIEYGNTIKTMLENNEKLADSMNSILKAMDGSKLIEKYDDWKISALGSVEAKKAEYDKHQEGQHSGAAGSGISTQPEQKTNSTNGFVSAGAAILNGQKNNDNIDPPFEQGDTIQLKNSKTGPSNGVGGHIPLPKQYTFGPPSMYWNMAPLSGPGLYQFRPNGEIVYTTGTVKNYSFHTVPISDYYAFDTGGYTGEWDSSGRIAMLHQKEIVLNAKDTENFLAAVNIVREVARSIDLNAMIQANGFGILSAASAVPTSQVLEQEVTIHAEFPNATNHSEIEEAFDTLLNRASQFANRKN